MQRSDRMQAFVESLKQTLNVSNDFVELSDHPYSCRCEKCLQWWVSMGPEDLGHGWGFGPFTEQEFIKAGGVVESYHLTEFSESIYHDDDREVPF